nr:molybdenum ABC transporter ATP-binding protein [Rhodoferax sp.]
MTGIQTRFRLARPGFTLDVELDWPARGVTALFGPSGSGKTTLLRCIAGLERAPQGFLRVDSDVWQDDTRWVPTHQRPLGYVFQEASLFAHLTVLGNLRYGLQRVSEVQGVSLAQAIELLGIGHLLERKPDRLSGGERQRVAIARALAVSPRLLLMDEPLAALDLKRRQEILPYLERLQSELDIPIVYVSHAIDEVARLADHLVLLEGGRVTASGPTGELMTQLDLSLAHGDSASAIIHASISGHEPAYHLTLAAFPGGRFCVPQQMMAVGQPLRIRVQARDVSLTLEPQTGTSILNILPVTVTAVSDDSPGQVMVGLDAGGTPLLARITYKSAQALGLVTGQTVYAQVKGVAILGP